MDTITCPFCQYKCKPTALLCPSCGLTFQRWIEANPGKIIEGWTPPANAPTPPPAEAAPAVATAAPLPESVAAQRVPPPGMKPELDPKAKALIELYKTEAAFRQNKGDAEKAPGRAGLLLVAMAIVNFVFGLILATQRFPGDALAFVSAFFGGSVFIVLCIGAFQAHKRFITAGLVVAVLDLAICISIYGKLGTALRNTIGIKLITVVYLAKLLMDIG